MPIPDHQNVDLTGPCWHFLTLFTQELFCWLSFSLFVNVLNLFIFLPVCVYIFLILFKCTKLKFAFFSKLQNDFEAAWFYTFCDFRNWTLCCRAGIFFISLIYKKIVSLAREAEFSFSKNHRDLKIIFCVENLQIPSFYFKNNRQKENSTYKF